MSTPSTAPRLDEIAFLKDAGADVLARFAGRYTWGTYEPGELVLDFDDVADDVFFLLTGTARVIVRAPSGREAILGDLAAGDFFGEMSAIDERPRSASVTALHRTRVVRMSGAVFMELVTAAPVLATRLMRVLTQRIRTGNDRLVEHAALDGKHRLYAELLRLARPRAGNAPGLAVTPPPVQQVLAGRIGLRREAVSREMAALIRDGVLQRTAAALVILKPGVLREAVEAALAD
jgi:CRP/FNR family transcriptional regulator, cyclic AMP receptor protein